MVKINQETDYDKILFNLIQNLGNYKFYTGGEGIVYIIDDKFIVKEYTGISNEDIFEQVFDKYCKECQMFAEMGLNVPKIYSWLKIPNLMGIYELRNKYFILEERMHGRELYIGNLSDYDKYCKNICSYEEFNRAYYARKDSALLDKIIQAYFEDYLSVNERLESMSDKQLEDFIMTIFKIYVEGVYSSPDVFFRNLIVDEEVNINLVDNNFKYYIEEFKSKTPIERLLNDIVKIIMNNYYIESEIPNLINNQNMNIIQKNKKVCKELLNRMIKMINNRIDNPKVKNNLVYNELNSSIISMFGKEEGKESLSLIQIEK